MQGLVFFMNPSLASITLTYFVMNGMIMSHKRRTYGDKFRDITWNLIKFHLFITQRRKVYVGM